MSDERATSAGRLELHWLALRALGTPARVVGETPHGEPVVIAGPDRLVLRRGGERFWLAGRCAVCGVEMAAVDVEGHEGACTGVGDAPATSDAAQRAVRQPERRPAERHDRSAPRPPRRPRPIPAGRNPLLTKTTMRSLAEWGEVLIIVISIAVVLLLLANSLSAAPLGGR